MKSSNSPPGRQSLFLPTSRLTKTIRPVNRTPKPKQKHLFESDLYHWLLVISWKRFLGMIFLFYFGLNLLFTPLYLLAGDGIGNARPGSFKDAFFFSIQTLSTVGYGYLYPKTLTTQILVTVELFVGLLAIAILTGLMFARFSRPTARVLFSEVAVICNFEGVPTLMFRAANRRANRILEAQVRVNFLQDHVTQEGHEIRRFYDLPLLRSQTPVFGLSWLIMHPINEQSPFYGKTTAEIEDSKAELWISLTGLDETFSQTIHTRYAYTANDFLWNHRFVDIFSKDQATDQWYIDLGRFHETEPLTD
jgi:inward rectifier potassium channel